MTLLNDISLGQYYPKNSFIHGLDPRTKLVAIMLLMTSLMLSDKPIILTGYLFFSVIIVAISQIPLSIVFRNLKPFIWLFIITLFIHILWTPGHIVATIPILNLDLTIEGIKFGLAYSLRLALLIVLAAILTLSTSPIELTDALEKLFSPLKRVRIPTHEIVLMLTLSLRFIPTLMEEAQRLKNAQISRGATFEGNIIKRIQNLIPLILPLFIAAFRRADDLALAMDSRCYTGGEGRTTFKHLTFKIHDYIVLGFCVICLILNVWLHFINFD